MIDYLKFTEMQKMFHGKSMIVAEIQHVIETQIITTNVNVVDVNVTTRSKVVKEQEFKDRESRKANNATNMERK
jgi:hypothetical protein